MEERQVFQQILRAGGLRSRLRRGRRDAAGGIGAVAGMSAGGTGAALGFGGGLRLCFGAAHAPAARWLARAAMPGAADLDRRAEAGPGSRAAAPARPCVFRARLARGPAEAVWVSGAWVSGGLDPGRLLVGRLRAGVLKVGESTSGGLGGRLSIDGSTGSCGSMVRRGLAGGALSFAVRRGVGRAAAHWPRAAALPGEAVTSTPPLQSFSQTS